MDKTLLGNIQLIPLKAKPETVSSFYFAEKVMYIYEGRNRRNFTAICQMNFGRKVIFTNVKAIDRSNIIEELGKALPIHSQNSDEINYLDRYYRGDAPIYYRTKEVRPEINNRVHINLSIPLVEMKVSEMASEPIQYVLLGIDEEKSKQVVRLNKILENENKQEVDIEICRWRSICGTAYRYIGNTEERFNPTSSFYLDSCDPRNTFVVYYSDNKQPAFSVQERFDEKNNKIYWIYTQSECFVIKGGEIVEEVINGRGYIPVVEYPNNARRLSDIEITIGINDVIDTLASDRENGVEQFVASFIKFVNCEIDEELFKKMRNEGALVVKSNNGSENKADVDLLTQELNQTEAQSVMDDLFNKFLVIQGLANRQGNTGGDTMGAVELRNGYKDSENRAELSEPIFKKAERQFLAILLRQLRIKEKIDLETIDIEIKISRNKNDNMLVKAQTLQMLLASGIYYPRAIKAVGMFSDPEQVAVESADRMAILYPTEQTEQTEKPNEVIEVEDV